MKLVCGILKLELEHGRYKNIAKHDHICKNCDYKVVEDEYHFLFDCNKYHIPRQLTINEIKQKNIIFNRENIGKIYHMYPNTMCKYVLDAWNLRTNNLYS